MKTPKMEYKKSGKVKSSGFVFWCYFFIYSLHSSILLPEKLFTTLVLPLPVQQ